mgnify:CR=1 FL=1
MAKVNHKRVRQLLNENRSKITDSQFFTSRILAGHFEDVAAAQTKRYRYNRRVHVNIYWNPKDSNGACTNNTSILINAGHPSITKIRGRMDRYEMISGYFAHELGHVLYTDFLAKQTYMNYLSSYKFYPAPPVLKTSQDAKNERDFWEYVKNVTPRLVWTDWKPQVPHCRLFILRAVAAASSFMDGNLCSMSISACEARRRLWRNGWNRSSIPSSRICRNARGETVADSPSYGKPRHGDSSSRRSLKRRILKLICGLTISKPLPDPSRSRKL